MKKGFTLTEMMGAVIIIGIIALLAFPLVLNMVRQTEKDLDDANKELVINAAKNYVARYSDDYPKSKNSIYYIGVSDLVNASLLSNNLISNTTLSDSSCVKINVNSDYNYEVQISCEEHSSEIVYGPTYEKAINGETYKGIAYLDPTDLTVTCNEELALANVNSNNTPTGITSGCMKFYIFDDAGDNYIMILDHNTSGNVAWNSSNSNTTMLEVKERLESDTEGWVGDPRLITEPEVRTITNNAGTSWYYFGSKNTTGYSSQNASQKAVQQSYAWLFDNLYQSANYGGTVSDDNKYPYGTKTSSSINYMYGYWTSSAVSGSANNVWYIHRTGDLYYNRANTANEYGVRPVITIPKTVFKNSSTTKTFGGTKVLAQIGETHKGVVYLDPTDLTATCTETLAKLNVNSDTNRSTGITSGCMKFYIYDDNGTTYKMILDHNTSGDVAYNSSNSNSSMNEVATRLSEDTSGWSGNPRLIDADEVATIVGAKSVNTINWSKSTATSSNWFYLDGGRNADPTSYSTSNGWQKQYADSTISSNYAWLLDNLYQSTNYGGIISDDNQYPYQTKTNSNVAVIWGYWINSAPTDSTNRVWRVHRNGHFGYTGANLANDSGVRPVIELPKTLIDTNIQEPEFGGTLVIADLDKTYKGIVYMNPVNLATICNEEITNRNVNSYGKSTGITAGCMKFYIYDDSDGNYKMILDHNTSGDVAWNSSNSNASMNEVATRLLQDTNRWVGSPRLIDADEVAHIVGAKNALSWDKNTATTSNWLYLDGSGTVYSGWQSQVVDSTTPSSYAWLFDNLYQSTNYGGSVSDDNRYPYGTKTSNNLSNIYGYWTSTAVYNSSNYAWRINWYAALRNNNNGVGSNGENGVRPVITLSQSLIKSNNIIKPSFGGTKVLAKSTDTHKGIVYMDPTNPKAICNERLASQNLNSNNTPTGIKSGCMKFYIFDDSGENYTMILDHNTSGNVAWNSSNTNTTMNEVATRLLQDTNRWVGSPRLIDADEVATIVGNTSWSKSISIIGYYFGTKDVTSYSSQTEKQKAVQQSYAWLFDNLYQSANNGGNVSDTNQYPYGGTNNKTYMYGYWTSSARLTTSDDVWFISEDGSLACYDSAANYYGVRPVITIPKAVF